MKNSVWLILLTLVVWFSIGCAGPIYYHKTINVVGDFYHDSAKVTFPDHLGDFHRKKITAYNKQQTDIGVSYEEVELKNRTMVSVYIYPAGAGFEDRLLNEYNKTLQSMANAADREIQGTQQNFPYSKDGYRVVGLTLRSQYEKLHEKDLLTLFECGKYFLKLRLTSNHLDFDWLDSLRDDFMNVFSPVELVKKHPLEPKASIFVAPAAFKDSSILYSTLHWALGKSKWAVENVDSLERCSGFPSLYLIGHTEPVLKMVANWDTSRDGKNAQFFEPFISLKKIIDAGYLNEFMMDEHQLLLITDLELDIEKYRKWKAMNLPQFNLNSRLFVIGYKK